MNVNGPPQADPGGAPAAPAAVQQTTVIQMGNHKSVGGAVALAFVFGPLGMLYATVVGGIVMFFVTIPVAFFTLGLGLLITIPTCMLWAGLAASSHNKRLQGVAGQQTIAPAAAVTAPPTASAQPAAPVQPADPPQATVSAPAITTAQESAGPGDEEPTVILKSQSRAGACGSCGGEIAPQARFCSACGAAQSPA